MRSTCSRFFARAASLVSIGGLASSTLFAHEGHGVVPAASGMHWFLEPVHSLATLSGVLLIGVVARRAVAGTARSTGSADDAFGGR